MHRDVHHLEQPGEAGKRGKNVRKCEGSFSFAACGGNGKGGKGLDVHPIRSLPSRVRNVGGGKARGVPSPRKGRRKKKRGKKKVFAQIFHG